MECVGDWIGRDEVDFTDDAGVAGAFGALEEFGIERFCVAFPATQWRRDDAVDVDKSIVAFLEPTKIWTVVVGVLVERKKQSGGVACLGCVKAFLNKAVELDKGQRRELGRVRVVE